MGVSFVYYRGQLRIGVATISYRDPPLALVIGVSFVYYCISGLGVVAAELLSVMTARFGSSESELFARQRESTRRCCPHLAISGEDQI